MAFIRYAIAFLERSTFSKTNETVEPLEAALAASHMASMTRVKLAILLQQIAGAVEYHTYSITSTVPSSVRPEFNNLTNGGTWIG